MAGETRIVAGLIVLMIALPLAGDGLRPRVALLWELRESGTSITTRLRQEIDLYLSRALTDTISMRVSFGANRYGLASQTNGFSFPASRGLELRPSGAFEARFGPVGVTTEYALRRSRYDVGERRTDRDDEQLGGRIELGATKVFPGASIRVSRHRLTDPGAGTEISNHEVTGSLQYSWRGFSVSAGQEIRSDRDSRGGYERTATDQNAALTFAQSWLGGKLNVSGSSVAASNRIDERVERGTRIPTPVTVSRALWSIDDTPLDTLDHPLTALPSLTDGRLGAASGIDLGPAGGSFQNIVFDIGRISPVDEIQFVVRDERLDPVVTPAGVSWDVYTSLEGERWTLHQNDATATFDEVLSRYDIAFEQVDTRWIKVVTFGTTARPVLVTEATLAFHREAEAGASESKFTTLVSSAAITVTPIRSVTLSYTGASYQTQQQSGLALRSDIRDLAHLVSARHDPAARFGYEVRYEARSSHTDRLEQHASAYAASIRFMPLPQLTTMLTCEQRRETTEELLITGRFCSAQASARIFPTLDLTLGGSQQQEGDAGGGSVSSRGFYANSTSRLTRTLRLTLSASTNRSESDVWTGPVAPPASDDRVTAEVDWSRGRAVGIGGTFGWARGETTSGLVQRYRLRWMPFGDGSISFTTSYAHEIDPYSNSRSERFVVAPRWQINASTALNLAYSSVSTTGGHAFESTSIFAALIFGR